MRDDYRRSEYESALAVEGAARGAGACDQWDAHKFLLRYGTAADLGNRVAEAYQMYRWWAGRGMLGKADRRAFRAAGEALDRLTDLLETAAWAEEELGRVGWAFDPAEGTLKEIKAGGTGRRGPRRRLVFRGHSAGVRATRFGRLAGQQHPQSPAPHPQATGRYVPACDADRNPDPIRSERRKIPEPAAPPQTPSPESPFLTVLRGRDFQL
jgi:hypothetical protein